MMKFVAAMTLVSGVVMVSVSAHAEVRTLQFWTCAIVEGKTSAEVQATNARWVKFVNGKVKGGDVHSYVVTAVTGDLGQFMFVDSYPSLEAWAAQRAAMATPEGAAIEAELDSVSKCTSSSLNTSTES